MSGIQFEDNSEEVKNAIEAACLEWLHEVSGEIQAQTVRNSRSDTGQTKGSVDYKVDEGSLKSQIGSPLENFIWEEFGTGQYALKGNGRKTPWTYQDKDGKFHRTIGKRPTRAFHNAYNSVKGKVKRLLESKLRGLG